MRPQRNAAENHDIDPTRGEEKLASMRPQRNAAENRAAAEMGSEIQRASMRPQRNAAENPIVAVYTSPPVSGFNEAAA